MQLFLRVAELESFSRAAETLSLPKGSVSRQIQALENALGTQLLHCTTRRVSLTQGGMVYYERAKDLLMNLDELDGMFLRPFNHQRSATCGYARCHCAKCSHSETACIFYNSFPALSWS